MVQSQTLARPQNPSANGKPAAPLFAGYRTHPKAWDELFAEPGLAHKHSRLILDRLGRLQASEFQERRTSADLVFVNEGITFSVYSDRRGVEKIFPFDLIPRPVAAAEWAVLEAGLVQRIQALNLFLHDIYHARRILREGVIPEELVLKSKGYRPEMVGFDPPGGQYFHVVGTDLVRDPSGQFLVLEDNGRCPSGVSYVLENRIVMKKVFPELFQDCRVRRVEDYPQRSARCSVVGCPPRRLRPAVRRSAVAGALQLRLFRAQLPGSPHGDRVGSGAGPVRPRRQGLPEDDARPTARGRHLPAASTTTSSTLTPSAPTASWACPA